MKTQTLQGEYRHVCLSDPALDKEAEDFRGRYDRAMESSELDAIPVKPDAKPVVWRMRHLGRQERAFIKDAIANMGGNQAADAAVALALVGAEGAVDAKGEPIDFARTGRVAGRFPALAEESLDAVEASYGFDVLLELWGRVAENMRPRIG